MKDNNTVIYSSIVKLLENQDDILQEGLCKLREKLKTSERSKVITYRDLNPSMNIKCNLLNLDVPEYMRVEITQLRLSSHTLVSNPFGNHTEHLWGRVGTERRV